MYTELVLTNYAHSPDVLTPFPQTPEEAPESRPSIPDARVLAAPALRLYAGGNGQGQQVTALQEPGVNGAHLRLVDNQEHPAVNDPTQYLLDTAVNLTEGELADRTVYGAAHVPGGTVAHTAMLTTFVERDGHRWVGPDVILRVTREPDESGELEASHVAIGMTRQGSHMGEGRFVFTASKVGEPHSAIYAEDWDKGQWRRTEITDKERQLELMAELAARFEDTRDVVPRRETKQKLQEWLQNDSSYLL